MTPDDIQKIADAVAQTVLGDHIDNKNPGQKKPVGKFTVAGALTEIERSIDQRFQELRDLIEKKG